MIEHALYYASIGWPVIPLMPAMKIPAISKAAGGQGSKDATTDEFALRSWWNMDPNYNVGVVMNNESGMLALDIDPRNGGTEGFAALCTQGEFPLTYTVATPTGGTHYYFRHPGVKLYGKLKSYPGIDVQAGGKYVVAPPSIHPDGGRYELSANYEVAELPAWLLAILARPAQPAHAKDAVAVDPNDDRPGAIFNRTATWEEVLEPAGWVLEFEDYDGEKFWRRPGKDEGWSASTGYNGTDLLWVFTSSTEFEPDTSYTKFGAHALLNYGGDYSEAGIDLAELNDQSGAAAQDITAAFENAQLIATSTAEPLPEGDFVPAFQPESFVGQFMRYASMLTDASLEYHEASALVLLATLTHGIKIELDPYPDGLSTNLFLVLVGGSTRSRKSTAQNIAKNMIKSALPKSLLPSRMTGEAAIYTMVGMSGKPALWLPDEFGVLLGQIFKRDFMRPLEELMLSLYGGEDYSYRTVRDTVTVTDPHLSILAAATPESLSLAGPGALLGGLLPRFGVVFPAAPPPERAVGVSRGVDGEKAALVTRMRAIIGSVHAPSQSLNRVKFEPEAVAILASYGSSLAGEGVHVDRLPMMLYKVAALSALADGRRLVNAYDAGISTVVINRWAEGSRRLQPFLRRKATDLELERLIDAVTTQLRATGGSALRSHISRPLKLDKGSASRVRDTMVEWGHLHAGPSKLHGNAEMWTLLEAIE